MTDTFAIASGLIFAALIWSKHSPFIYYVYVAFPIFFWTEVLQKRFVIRDLFSDALKKSKWWEPILAVISYVIGLELLVCN